MLSFDELLTQVVEMLQRQGRISYGALKRRYELDDDYLQDLKDELIEAQRIATDENGRVLVWTGEKAEGRKGATGAAGEKAVRSAQFAVRTAQPPTSSTQPPTAERRQLTVMFCDLVGSTALSTQLDPEELRSFVQQYQAVCAQVVESYEGYIAQYLGDGILVYFGYPHAHEDDARRAVQAGVEIVEVFQRRARQQAIQIPHLFSRSVDSLHVRIGIHTGLVVVGEMGSGRRYEQLALGETPNIAARLQGMAEPDTVVISATTYQLVASYFECRSLGLRNLKGLALPLNAYQVVRKSRARHHFEVIAPTHLTPLIGRGEECEFLEKCWERAKEGNGQVVLLSGEPGIGKSRLVHRLKERIDSTAALRLETWCSTYHQNTTLYPMVEFLQRSLQLQVDESPEVQLTKLERALTSTGVDLPSTLPFLADLLGLSSSRFPLLALSPQKQRERLHQAMLLFMLKSAEQRPVLSVWEDVQWADPSTLEWLELLVEQTAMARLLVVLTFRPEFTPPWPSHSHIRPLNLGRLNHQDSEMMITALAAEKSIPREVVEQIVNKTDGVPLFVEELAKMVLESGMLREVDGHYELMEPLPPLAIPTTLQDSLVARLDRLGRAREVAQIGAVLGREFSYELIRAVVPRDEASLQHDLACLLEAEILYQRGMGRHAHYIFRHALIQDAAYQSLLKSRRQQYHQWIAQTLEERFPETTATEPELVAHHYTEAGLPAQALPYWRKAGQMAIQRSANTEAIRHLQKALALTALLPDTNERTQLELTLQVTLGVPLMALKGYAAAEVEHVYARARELSQSAGEVPQLFPVLSGLFAFYLVRGELQTARSFAEQCLRLAQKVQESTLLVEAHRMLGNVLLFLGDPSVTLFHLEQSLSFYDAEQHGALAFVSGQDPQVVCRSFSAWSLRTLGYFDQAMQRSAEAVAYARTLAHANSLALALAFAANLCNYSRDWQAAEQYAAEAIALASEQGFPLWLALGTFYRGWTLAGQGHYEEGVAMMHEGMAAYQRTGAQVGQSSHLCILAGILGAMERPAEGLAAVHAAHGLVEKNGERGMESEILRVKGELLLAQASKGQESAFPNRQAAIHNPQADAEACFLAALALARKQGAKLYELHAGVSLSRLWQQQGKRKEAYQLLVEIYGWFTEGFATYDLREARALLEELG